MEVIAVESARFKHQQVEAEIRRLVGTLPIGARVPPERRLAELYGCNFLTVRRALKALVEDGSIVRRAGSGTFVARNVKLDTEAGESSRVGMLIWQGGDAYAHRVLQGLAQEGVAQNVELRSAWVREFGVEALERARELIDEGCAALTIPWFPHDRADEVRSFARACPVPVSLPMLVPGLEANCFERQELFSQNLQSVVEQVCAYYHALGCRRIAFLGPDLPGDVVLHRMVSTYACYTSRMGLANFCGLVAPGAAAMDALIGRWREHAGDLAVVSYDDDHALRFMAAMKRQGFGAPSHFRIIGYNDTEASACSEPPLTTISQNFHYIGHWLIKNALALARGGTAQSSSLPRSQVQVRATCGGASVIDEAFRQRFPNLDFIVNDGVVSAAVDRE